MTRDMAQNHIYAGTPAMDITDKLGAPYRDVSVEDKYDAMLEQLASFSTKHDPQGAIQIVTDWPAKMDASVSYFNVRTRQYTKRLPDIEIVFTLHLLVPIKFYPAHGPIQDTVES